MTNPVGVKKRRVSVFSSAAKSHQQWCLGSGYAKITFLPKTCCEHFMDSDSSGQSVGSESNLGFEFSKLEVKRPFMHLFSRPTVQVT